MRKIFQLFLVLLSIGVTHAQLQGADSQSNLNSLSGGEGMFRSFDNRFKGIEGSPLLFDKYLSGKIFFNNGISVQNKRMNYDAYTQELIIERENKEFLIDSKLIKEFHIYKDGDTLFFEKFTNDKGKLIFYQSLWNRKINLFIFHSKTVLQPTNTGAYSSGKIYSQFEQAASYYYRTPAGKSQLIKNKKSVLNLFRSHQDVIENFIKENDTNFNKEEDLIKLFSYINSKEINSTGD